MILDVESPVDNRARRIGENEVVFRDLNERLKELNEAFSLVDEHTSFVCECGDPRCTERITMSLAQYENLRSHADWFAVVRGHETAEVEAVIEEREGYDVVAKHEGGPAQLARAHNPRP